MSLSRDLTTPAKICCCGFTLGFELEVPPTHPNRLWFAYSLGGAWNWSGQFRADCGSDFRKNPCAHSLADLEYEAGLETGHMARLPPFFGWLIDRVKIPVDYLVIEFAFPIWQDRHLYYTLLSINRPGAAGLIDWLSIVIRPAGIAWHCRLWLWPLLLFLCVLCSYVNHRGIALDYLIIARTGHMARTYYYH